MNVHGTLEVTTAKVCPVNCAPMCPQLAFRDVYGGKVDQLLSLENFKRAIASVPKEVRINFAGFAEPCVNPDFLEMLEFAKAEGHPVDLFTTLLGAKPDWIPRIKAVHPDNIVLHLPDNEGIAHLPPSEVYLKTLYTALRNLEITSFSRMSAAFGFVSNERAGNCDGAPPRHVWGPFHCARLTPAAFVMLPDCSAVLCCFHPDTEVFARVQFKRYHEVVVGVFSLLELYAAQERGSIENLWTSNRGGWQSSTVVRSPNPGFVQIVLENGVKLLPTSNHLFDAVSGTEATASMSTVAAISLRPGQLLPFDLSGLPMDQNLGDEDLGRFVGLYLAEGTAGSVLHLGDSSSEQDLAAFLMGFAGRRLGASSYWTHLPSRPESHSTYVHIGRSAAIRGVVSDFVGGRDFKTKFLKPAAFNTSLEFRRGVIRGIWEGDGQERPNASVLTLANPRLAEQVTQLLASTGRLYTVNPHQYTSKAGNPIAVVNRVKDVGKASPQMRGKYAFPLVSGQRAWCRIKEVRSVGRLRNRFAYCIQVTYGEPYFTLANGVSTHNCMDWRLKHRMGNLLTQTWQDLLDSAERRRLIKNSHRLDGDTLCRSCTFPISLKTLAPKRENAPVLGYLIREIGQRITSEA